MELGKVRAVHSLISEHPVNGEVLGRLEAILGQFVQHAAGYSCGVGTQKVLLCFCQLPCMPIPA